MYFTSVTSNSIILEINVQQKLQYYYVLQCVHVCTINCQLKWGCYQTLHPYVTVQKSIFICNSMFQEAS